MTGSLVNFQMSKQLISQPSLWQHTLDCFFNNTFWNSLSDISQCFNFQAARSTDRVSVVEFSKFLISSDCDLICVDDNDVRAHVHGRGVGGFVLASDVIGCQTGKTAECLALGVDNVPVFVYVG